MRDSLLFDVFLFTMSTAVVFGLLATSNLGNKDAERWRNLSWWAWLIATMNFIACAVVHMMT